jgi:hypothetical protein
MEGIKKLQNDSAFPYTKLKELENNNIKILTLSNPQVTKFEIEY